MMCRFLAIFALALLAYTTNAQQLTGKITDNSSKPIPGATLTIKKLNLSTLSDPSGNFSINNLPTGNHMLSVSYMGFESRNLTIHIKDGSQMINISLSEQQNLLQGVEITGRKERSYKNTRSFTGTKTETELKYVPQSISYVTKEVIEDQQGFRMGDIIKNVSGASIFSYYNNDMTLRGFRTGVPLINGLKTVSSEGWKQSILSNIERVDIIKGPASALFANSDPGGTVNMVTKKPLDETRRSVSFGTGSFNTYRFSTDLTGPMNESKTLLYRINTAYQNAESFRVLQGGEDVMVAPSFSFIPDDKTLINFDLVYSRSNGRLDRGQPIFGATAGTDLHSTPISFAIGKQNDFLKETNLYATTSLQRKITDKITFNASYMKFMYQEDLLEHRTSNNYAVDATGATIPTLMEMRTTRRQGKNYNDNVTLYLVGDFNTGKIEHKLLGGFDYFQNQTPVGNSSYNARGYLNAAGTGVINSYNPSRQANYLIRDGRPVPNVPHFDLINPDYGISEISRYINVSEQLPATRYFATSYYLQDQIKWGKVQALLSLRQEYYTDVENYKSANSRDIKQKALIPRIGLVYSPTDNLNFYGTYTEGYQPQGAAIVGAQSIYGGPFDPLISNMYEIGTKTEFFQKRLAINIALYRIEQNNTLMTANDAANPDLLRQIGQQRSRGVEVDINGMVLSNLSLTANFSYSKATITESAIPAEIGTLLPNAPKFQGGFWAKYNFLIPELKGIGLGAGMNYSGRRTTLSTILQLPEYTIFNAALYYSVDKVKVSANLNNIFDQTHWVGGYDFNRLFPGNPRNFMIGIAYTF